MVRLTIRVIPRSSKNEITREGDTFKVYLTAPPVDGAANQALIDLLAQRLNLPKRALRIIQGATGRRKLLEIESLTLEELTQRLPL
jgi:uncharacterized protein (TIGR00251 family)